MRKIASTVYKIIFLFIVNITFLSLRADLSAWQSIFYVLYSFFCENFIFLLKYSLFANFFTILILTLIFEKYFILVFHTRFFYFIPILALPFLCWFLLLYTCFSYPYLHSFFVTTLYLFQKFLCFIIGSVSNVLFLQINYLIIKLVTTV